MSLDEWTTEVLNKFPEVMWDRYIEDGEGYVLYGWIERDDLYKDFMVIEINGDGDYYFITSSAIYSKEFHDRIESEEEHQDCKRIEHYFKNVNNKVIL